MVGLNYKKWDNLELSDDSDVEVHPNVDKRSFIRWKQRDIHEKRQQRKEQVDALRAERKTNEQLLPRLDQLLSGTANEGHAYYSREVARLSAGRKERGNKDGPDGPTVDDMLLSLLLQVQADDEKVKAKQGAELDGALVQALEHHRDRLAGRQREVVEQITAMEREDAAKITSESVREGWSAGHVNKSADAPPPARPKGKQKETVVETINSPAESAAGGRSSGVGGGGGDDNGDDDDEEVPTLTPTMLEFAKLPPCIPLYPPTTSSLPETFLPKRDVRAEPFETAFRFLSDHRELVPEQAGTTDALLVEAFQANMRGDTILARKCVEKALLVQYCNKLGRDGVSLFFKRMTGADGRAAAVFFNDVLSTFARIYERSKALKAEGTGGGGGSGVGTEQIQLVAEDPSTVISFEVPDGPPPEHIELEGEAAERLDVAQVREFLQRRWEIFTLLPARMQEALRTKELDRVNRVLGDMGVDEAEEVVKKLDQAGILSFSSSEVRDETGGGGQAGAGA